MLHAVNRTAPARWIGIAARIAGLVLLTACACPVRADEIPRAGTPEAQAGRLVEEVLRKAGGNDPDSLGAWTRSILDRALEKSGETARRTIPGSMSPGSASGTGRAGSARPGEAVPLPAERHSGVFAGPRPASAEILIFTSLSVPAMSWGQWAHDGALTGAPLVLRGVGTGGLRETAKRIGARLDGHEAGVAIDPRLFRLFGIERVPAVVVVPGGVPPCESRGCTDDPAPPHDLVAGNIGFIAALEAVAAEGEAGREIAKASLERLRGGGP